MNTLRDQHGGITSEERAALRAKFGPDFVPVDLSVNINPYGPPPGVLAAVRSCRISDYPDATASDLRVEYGRRLDISPRQLVFGNGATELLWTLARYLTSTASPALIVEPTFSEYARAAKASGARVIGHWTDAAPGAQPDPDAIAREVHQVGAGSLYLCRPNNPTGCVLPFEELRGLAQALARVAVVLDESFLSLSDVADDAGLKLPANVIRVRSLTKDFGIPGLRLGYLIASPGISAALEGSRPPWTTSAPAQAGAMAILEEDAFLAGSRRRLLEGRDELLQSLLKLGMQPSPTATIFTLVDVGGGRSFRKRLVRNGVVVRDAASFGLPDHVRIAVGSPSMHQKLWAAIEADRVASTRQRGPRV